MTKNLDTSHATDPETKKSPQGFHEYKMPSGGLSWVEAVLNVHQNFAGLTNIQIFHRDGSDIGGDIMIQMTVNGKVSKFLSTYQSRIDTLTNQRIGDLPDILQTMSPENRGIYNTIIFYLQGLEKGKQAIKKGTRISLKDITPNDANFTA